MRTRWVLPTIVVTTVLLLGSAWNHTAGAQSMDGMDWVIKGQKGTADSKTVVPNTLTPKEQKAGWALLWNGQSLAGWHSYGGDPIVGWEFADGALINPGGAKAYSLVTDEEFEDFELTLEWRTAPKGDSGICYLVDERGGDMQSAGLEYQVADDSEAAGQRDMRRVSGAVVGLVGPKRPASALLGQWNTTRIVVDRGKVQHWLNGDKTAQFQLWTPEWEKLKAGGPWKDVEGYGAARRGRIGLLAGEGEVHFRSIKIRRLKSTS